MKEHFVRKTNEFLQELPFPRLKAYYKSEVAYFHNLHTWSHRKYECAFLTETIEEVEEHKNEHHKDLMFVKAIYKTREAEEAK